MKPVFIIAIVAVAMIGVMVPSAFAEYDSLEQIQNDFNLKCNAYDHYLHPYMAFLNCDKANNQSKKDLNYNKVENYKIFLKQKADNEIYRDESFQVTHQNIVEIIQNSYQIKDFETLFKYSEILETIHPDNGYAYHNKIDALIFLQRQNEAIDLLEKVVNSPITPFEAHSQAHITKQMKLLYSIGNYQEVLDVKESWDDLRAEMYGTHKISKINPLLIAMTHEKLGNAHTPKIWYDEAQSHNDYWDVECNKPNWLFFMGLHEEVVSLVESDPIFLACPSDVSFHPYVISKDILTEQYHSPIIPKPAKSGLASFVDQSKDPQHYIDRYYNEPTYKEWFDENYPQFSSIYEAVGIEKSNEEVLPNCENGDKNGLCIVSDEFRQKCMGLVDTITSYETDLSISLNQFNIAVTEYYDSNCKSTEKLWYVESDTSFIGLKKSDDSPELTEKANIVCGTGTIENAQGQCVAEQKTSSKGGGCLIATATYGSELAPQVQQLRELRDNQLLNTESGKQFMGAFNDIYYSFSPTIADYERENPYFKDAVKLAITPMISSLSLMENAESESEVLSIGTSVIMLNLGMYLGIPAIVVIGIRKRF